MRRHWWLALAGLLVCVVVAVLGPAGVARGGEIDKPPDCNLDGRLFCIELHTYSGITASDPTRSDGTRYTWVEWQVSNDSGSTLTHPEITVTLEDRCDYDGKPDTEPTQCRLANGQPSLTSAFVLPDSSNACALSGPALHCAYANLAAGANTGFTRVYFKTADTPAVETLISVTGTVKERSNDENSCGAGDPNCDTFTTSITNSYEPDPTAGLTFALDGRRFHIATNDEFSSFDFTSKNPTPFLATLETLGFSTTYCFGDVPCFERTLYVDTHGASGFGSTNPVVFYARLVNPPAGVNQNTLSAIHFYDAVTLHADASSNRFTGPSGTSFARIDGVRFEADAASVIAAGKYYVVNYQASSNSFQVSTAPGGAPVTLGATTDVQGGPIRIIGDQSDERSNAGCTTTFSSAIPIPSICVQKLNGVQPKTFDSWVWDSGNGWVQH